MDGEDRVIENIRTRRSIRDFQPRPIPREVIEKIVEAGAFAPSALNVQPWKFIIVEDKKIIDELSKTAIAKIRKLFKFIPLFKLFVRDLRDKRFVNALEKTAKSPSDTVFYNAPLLIMIANDTRYSDSEQDCRLAAQNMMLAAHALGIGSCFIGRAQVIPKKLLVERFNLPSGYDIKVHLIFGYPEGVPRSLPPRKKDIVIWGPKR